MVASLSKPPLLLAVDASTVPASVCLLSGEEVLSQRVAPPDPRTDAWLHPALDGCLRDAELELAAVEGFAVTVGPGTFTGIRVGLATCLGMAAPGDLPVCGVGTLEAVAEASGVRDGWLAAALDARRGQLYGALYRVPRRAAPPLEAGWGPRVCDAPDFLAAVGARAPGVPIAGNGRRLLGERGDGLDHGPLAAAAGRLVSRGWADRGPDGWPAPAPFYLRDADVRLAPNPLLQRDSDDRP